MDFNQDVKYFWITRRSAGSIGLAYHTGYETNLVFKTVLYGEMKVNMTKSHFNLLHAATDFGSNSLWQTSYLKDNSWMSILHQYHKASGLKACTVMCRSEKCKWGNIFKMAGDRFAVHVSSAVWVCNVLDHIWHENEQNYMANMIMNVPGAVFQLIHYFPGKQGLAINLLWPALQSKQHTYIEFVDITRNMFTWTSLADQCGFSSC